MDDLIAKQAAIGMFLGLAYSDRNRGVTTTLTNAYSEDAKMVKALPSAQPERNRGKWVEKEVIHADEAKEAIEEWQSCKCSVCGRYDTRPYMYYFSEPRFCSWCGAENEGE